MTRMRYRVGQLRKTVACVRYEYRDPRSRTDATGSRQLALQLQLAQPPPQTQEVTGSWEPHPHNPTRSLGPRVSGPWGEEGAEGNIRMFSVQLPDTRCRIFELRDQTAAGGLPPNPQGARHKPSQLVNKSSPPRSLSPPRGLQTAQGAAVLASRARKSIFPAHTHSLSINTGPWTLRQPPTVPKQKRVGLWDARSFPPFKTPAPTAPGTLKTCTHPITPADPS